MIIEDSEDESGSEGARLAKERSLARRVTMTIILCFSGQPDTPFARYVPFLYHLPSIANLHLCNANALLRIWIGQMP